MKRLLNQMLSLAVVAVLLPSATGLMAENIVFSGTDFESWNPPKGLVEVQVDGINIKRFGKSFNAVADAHEYSSRSYWRSVRQCSSCAHAFKPGRCASNRRSGPQDLVETRDRGPDG